MEVWLDTSNLELIHGAHIIPIRGVTTNPTIAGASHLPLEKLIEQILTIQKGFLCVQVVSDDFNLILEQAHLLLAISERIIPKIQVTQNGLRAITHLSQKGKKILATAIIEPRQALLAFLAGASYLALYMGKIEDLGQDPIEIIKSMHKMKLENGFTGKIMAAGIRKTAYVTTCSEIGVDASQKASTKSLLLKARIRKLHCVLLR